MVLDLVFGSRRRVKKVRIFRAWFSHGSGAVSALEPLERKPFSRLRSPTLSNRHKMVNAFTNTEWVSGSGGAIISRSVTSCAGMTAFLVLLAQTRVGFLSGGRGKSFYQLPASQKEEVYGRATVALTRVQQICFIMGPLNMSGLVGAATIIGCLK